jgi:hypothetical protein
MKLYNPFKPHIVELSNGNFAVRQLGSHGWSYMESRRPYDYWWCSFEFKHHFEVTTLERAQELLGVAHELNKPPPKLKVVKVHLCE